LSAQAATVTVTAMGTVSEVFDPDNLLPFDPLVVGQTPGLMAFKYDDQTPATQSSSLSLAFYDTGETMTITLGNSAVSDDPMTITMWDDWESSSTPGIYRDTWQASAATRQFNSPMPDILFSTDFILSTSGSTLPISTLSSSDLVKPEWPNGWSEGWFQYLIFSQPQGTSDVNVLARVKVNVETLSAVPIPAAVWLFGSALGLLGWLRRKTAYRLQYEHLTRKSRGF
jgi:hypothetical protein